MQAQNGQEPVSLQTVVEILCGFEATFNEIEVRFSDFDARFNSLNQAIERDMRSLKTEMWNGEQRVESRLNTKVAIVESSVKFFDDKVMQKFITMEDSIGLLSDSVRAVSLGSSGSSQTVPGAVSRSQQPQSISTVSSLAVTSHGDGGSNAAGGYTAPWRPAFVSASDVAETTPVLRAPAGMSVSIAEPLLQFTMVSAPRAAVAIHLGRCRCSLNLFFGGAILLKTVCQPFILTLSVMLLYPVLVALLIWLVSGGW